MSLSRGHTTATGEMMSLHCITSGSPAPVIRWLKEGIQINTDDSSRYILYENGTLTIDSLRLQDEGNYTCIASNTIGADSDVISIAVEGKYLCNICW